MGEARQSNDDEKVALAYDYRWVQEQIKTHYFSAHAVSAILDVTVATGDAKERDVIIKRMAKHLKSGIMVTGQTQPIVVTFEPCPLSSSMARFWICREAWHDNIKFAYVKAAVDRANKSSKHGCKLIFLLNKPLDSIDLYSVHVK